LALVPSPFSDREGQEHSCNGGDFASKKLKSHRPTRASCLAYYIRISGPAFQKMESLPFFNLQEMGLLFFKSLSTFILKLACLDYKLLNGRSSS
jgi:hypothetical protein